MAFDDLKGIEAERTPEERESNLERLIETVDEIVDIQTTLIDPNTSLNTKEVFGGMYEELKSRSLDFTDGDLRSLILTRANNDYEPKKSRVLGNATACLLQLWSEKNHKIFYINGKGNRFDNLFHGTKKAKGVIVENFKGDNICRYMGNAEGKIGLVMCQNIEGNGTMKNLAHNESKIGLAIAKNVTGNETMANSAQNAGSLGMIIAKDTQGNETLWGCGGQRHEALGMIYAENIKGDNTLHYTYTGAQNIGVLLYDKVNIAADAMNTILAKEKISKTEKPSRFEKYIKEYRVGEILDLIDSMEGKSDEEKARIGQRMYDIYRKVERCWKT